MRDIDAGALPPEKAWPEQYSVMSFIPTDAANGVLVVEGLRIHDVTNQSAIDVTLTAPAPQRVEDPISIVKPKKPRTAAPQTLPASRPAFSSVTIRDCEIAGVHINQAGAAGRLSVSAIRIHGFEESPSADVTVSDVVVRDTPLVSLRIQGGNIRTLTLRRLNLAHRDRESLQISLLDGGSVQEVLIDECPGLSVALLGAQDAVRHVIMRNSPEANVNDMATYAGRTNAVVKTETTADAGSTTHPAAVTELRVGGDIAGGRFQASVAGPLPPHLSMVIFQVVDDQNYRICTPQTAASPPWQTDFHATRPGHYRVQAELRDRNGDPVKVLSVPVDVVTPK